MRNVDFGKMRAKEKWREEEAQNKKKNFSIDWESWSLNRICLRKFLFIHDFEQNVPRWIFFFISPKQIELEWFIKSHMQYGFSLSPPITISKSTQKITNAWREFYLFFCLSRDYKTFCHDIWLDFLLLLGVFFPLQLAGAYRISQRKTFSWWISSPP